MKKDFPSDKRHVLVKLTEKECVWILAGIEGEGRFDMVDGKRKFHLRLDQSVYYKMLAKVR